ncbi:cysteine-rich receptor-like protein kinase 10 [Nymphaea colorata]|nr:cysteine-rich receptor-like protein kinase 10 [Nymphaea colorata]
MLATGNIPYTDLQTIYGLVQCTGDIILADCKQCLDTIRSQIPTTCDTAHGCEIATGSCQVVYDTELFYDTTTAPCLPPQSSSPPPPNSSPPSNDPVRKMHLDWQIRSKIISGVARGLLYLHEDSQLKIIHRDLKASNILLDQNMTAKISDFGMAKLVGVEETQGKTSKVAGTYGYMAPEYVMQGQFSVKSDVFRFGVLILGTISGLKNSSFPRSQYGPSLLDYAWRLWRENRATELLDESLTHSSDGSEVARCIHIGLLCVLEDATRRPTMSSIVLMLNSR